MKREIGKKNVDNLFEVDFPIKTTHDEPTSFEGVMGRKMEIHLTRTHFGKALFVGANTGRHIWPHMTFRRGSWYDDMYPQCNIGGWKTRFDGGRQGEAEPSILVALYYQGELDELDDNDFFHIYDGVALFVFRYQIDGRIVRRETFIQAPPPRHDVQVLAHDGLEAIHQVLCDYRAQKNQSTENTEGTIIDKADVDEKTQKILRWGIRRVEDNFGQGPFKING